MITERMTMEAFIRKSLSIPYKHRGRDWNGADCLGYIQLFYAHVLGILVMDTEEEYDEDWAFKGDKNYFLENYHKQFEKIDQPRVFSIILFQNRKGIANHAGVVLPNGKFVHLYKHGVSVDHYNEEAYKKRINGYYRYKYGLEKKD